MPEARIENNTLGPDGPAWKALIVESLQNLTTSALETLSGYAHEGLPVVLIDGDPGCYYLEDGSSCDTFASQLAAFKDQEMVYSIPADELSPLLQSLEISPRITADERASLLTVWRGSLQDGAEYAFVFADLVSFSGQITVATTKTPYLLDVWTGKRSPILVYSHNGSTTTIPIDLKVNQTMLLAFTDSLSTEIPTPSHHITHSPAQVVGYDVHETAGISVFVESSQSTGTLRTSMGQDMTINSSGVPAPFGLSNWTLLAEQWEAPSNLSEVKTIAVKRNTTHSLSQLQSWREIPQLVNASGIGYYTTTFDWPSSEGNNSNNATTDLGAHLTTTSALLNVARLQINDYLFTGLDPAGVKVDISRALRPGTNEVVIIAPTVMWNYLRTIFGELRNAGTVPLLVQYVEAFGGMADAVDVGLTGEVLVSPFQRIALT